MKIESRQLRHLLALGEHLHYARAADALNITQPALTRSIQMLEAAVDARLFDRGRSEVVPTAMGQLMLGYAKQWELGVKELQRDIQLAQTAQIGHLRVGLGPFSAAAWVGEALGRLSQARPELHIEVVVGPWQEMPQRLRARDIDLLVAELQPIEQREEYELTWLKPRRMLAVVRADHPLTLLSGTPSTQALGSYPWAGPVLPAHLGRAISQGRGRAKRMANLSIRCDNAAVLKDMVRSSDMVMFTSAQVVLRELREGSLAVVPGLNLGQHNRFGLARIQGRSRSPAEEALIQQLIHLDDALLQEENALLASEEVPESRS